MKAGLQSQITGQLQNMIIRKRSIPAADVLIQIAGFQVKRWMKSVAQSQVKAVLVKEFTINIRLVANIHEYLILQSGKHSFGKYFFLLKRQHIPYKIAEAVRIHRAIIL